MSMHRKLARDAVRTALKADARFSAMAARRSWIQNIDGDGLPCFTVATPREVAQSAAKDTLRRQIDLAVLVQRQGGDDLEDIADADAEAIEALVPPVVAALAGVLDVMVAVTEFRLSGTQAGKRISTLDIRFAVTVLTDRPAT